jgi:hypothetical protein
MNIEEFKNLIERKNIEIPEGKIMTFYELINQTSNLVIDEWMKEKIN